MSSIETRPARVCRAIVAESFPRSLLERVLAMAAAMAAAMDA